MSDRTVPNTVGLHHVEDVMGTAVSIDLRGQVASVALIAEVTDWLHHVDDTFSTHKLESPISAMGRGELAYEDATEEIREVLRLCETMLLDTDGAFDVFEVPAPNGTRFDPSGLVKGWAVQRAAELLEVYGCDNFCLNAGGDVALRGRPAPGQEWSVGIRHPRQRDAIALVIKAAGRLAVATSATYERGDHIFDPSTGWATTHLASATVVGPDLTIADAYATALFVKGRAGLTWLEGREGYDGYVITNDNRTFWTPGFNGFRND